MISQNESVLHPKGPADLESAALPEPGGFDAHTHVDIMGLPVDAVLAAASVAGIKRVVNVGCDLPSSRWSVSAAAEYADVYAAVAIHPNETGAVYREREPVLAAITELAESPKVVAIGETGLDYYRDRAAREVQQAWFRAHIELAQRTGKALMIHDRDAHSDVLDILEETGPWPPDSVIFHCFSGDA
ncbi:MAG TPA: TatD family hydrolase, partial [Trebonia sp.]|nr:TatD family hydrolase [Trebonia sp.]